MIFEEFLNVVWFLFGKKLENDINSSEGLNLNGDEDRANTESVENGSDGAVDKEREINDEAEETNGTEPRENQGQCLFHFKTYIFPFHQTLTGCSVWPSLKAGLQVSVKTLLVAIVLSAVAAIFLYLDFELTDKCLSTMRFHRTIPARVGRWEFVGEPMQAIIVNLWFPATMALLHLPQLNQKLHAKHIIQLIIVGFAVAAIQIIAKGYLIAFNEYGRSCNEVFFLGVACSCYLVGKAVSETHEDDANSKRLKWKITACIAAQFFLMFIIALCHRFGVIPLFNRENDLTTKALVALIPPVLAYFATSISKYLALACSSSWLVEPNRMYVIVYFNQLLPLALFRVMQADFDGWQLFVSLSFIYGGVNLFCLITRESRKTTWNELMESVGKGWPRLKDRPSALFDDPRSERLQVDLEIQGILYHYAMIILSQIYIALYRYSTFDVPFQEEVSRMSRRLVIGLLIEIFFNIFSVLLQIRFHGSEIRRVWSDCRFRKHHCLANAVLVTITIYYFSQVLFSVLHVPTDGTLAGYRVRNCSLPFTYE